MQVTHDCREDCAALYGQHKIKLDFVFDTQVRSAGARSQTREPSSNRLLLCARKSCFANRSNGLFFPSEDALQVAHILICMKEGTTPYQASLPELLGRYLNLQ